MMSSRAAAAGDLVVNTHHEMVQLGSLEREVSKLFDGHRSRRDIVNVLVGRFEGDTLTLEDAGNPVTEPNVARAMLSHKLETATDPHP
jgi:methyltransferase-like protein